MAFLTSWRVVLIAAPALAVVLGLLLTHFGAAIGLNYGRAKAGGSLEIIKILDEPLVVYLKNFITPDEAAHLVQLAEGRFAPSILWTDEGTPRVDKAYRKSMTARLDRDEVSQRIEARARSMPFYKPLGDFQPLVVQNYGVAGVYRDHYDWYDDAHAVGGNVASTFFVYIHANCTGGGTNFPRLRLPAPAPGSGDGDGYREDWCEFVDCDRPLDEGVTFKPVLGNAVYWENLHENGAGDVATLHSGQPVTSGNKMGMNLWTWQPVERIIKKKD
ncbi:hypothetical protein BX600DRAFT_444849 [Xylariales sp. PMI_506]|nr:hypothetical protein BX600DRAFT_444849 [Xylariales sp. PMI_506]